MSTEALILTIIASVLILTISHASAFFGGRNRGAEHVVQKLLGEVNWYTAEIAHSPSVYKIVRLVTGKSTREEVKQEAQKRREAGHNV